LCEHYRQGERVEAEDLHVEMSGLVVSDVMVMVMVVMGLILAKQDVQLLYITMAVMAKAEN
jgi:hypothetical protein